jgi:Pyruvate/2-oxoacid:ferredoxin oxidoreductase delta subunit
MTKDGEAVNREWCKGSGICVDCCQKETLVLDDDEKACRGRSSG